MVVSRFAPSPTGYLHVGSARTALYSWLLAKKMKGTFILRIEDTDRERSTEEAVQVILDGLQWLNLDWDQGPFYQTHRFERYAEVIQQLVDAGHAYRCYCTKERLESLRESQIQAKVKARYDGLCRNCPPQEQANYVIRFKNPQEGSVVFDDVVHGAIEFQNSELDDLIIARTDGTPTYNLTVVVDDWDMGVTHVLRGDDHINNTPRQINLLLAMKAPLPVYGHMPMLLGDDGKKLSKRRGAASVLDYREMGILPHALLNYLVRLGWSHGDQEIFSIEEMIEKFDIRAINCSPAAFNHDKLLWLNQHYLKTTDVSTVAAYLVPYYTQCGIELSEGPDLHALVPVYTERCKTLVEMVEASRYLFEDFTTYDPKGIKLFNKDTLSALEAVLVKFNQVKDWTKESIGGSIKHLSDELGVGLGKLMPPIRLSVTGSTVSPSLDVTLELLGRDKTLSRLTKAIEFFKAEVKA